MVNELEPDAFTIQEISTHYSTNFTPPQIYGYFCDINDIPMYDKCLKNVIYVKNKYKEYTIIVKIPDKHNIFPPDVFIDSDFIKWNNHYSTWVLIHPTPNSSISQSTLIGSYYRSPNHNAKKSDIKLLKYILNYIIKTYRQCKFKNNELIQLNNIIKSIIITGDFNIHNELFSRINFDKYRRRDRLEFKWLDMILESKHLSIINSQRIPTHEKGNILDLQIASANLLHSYQCYIIKCINNNTPNYKISDHNAIFTIFNSNYNAPKYYTINDNQFQVNNINFNFSNPKNVELYIKITIKQLKKLESYIKSIKKLTPYKIDKYSNKFRNIIYKNATKYIGKNNNKKYKLRYIWCTKEIIDKSNELKLLKRQWLSTNNNNYNLKQINKNIYKKHKNHLTYLCRQAKKNRTRRNIQSTINGELNVHKSMTYLRKMDTPKINNSHIPYIITDSNNNTNEFIHNNHQKANLFANKFCHRYLNDINYQTQEQISFSAIPKHNNIYPVTHMINNITTTPKLPANQIDNPRYTKDYTYKKACNIIELPFNNDLITYILKTIKKKCNHGIGIHIKLLLLLQPYIIQFLTTYLNTFYISGYFPLIHKLTYINPIQKPKRSNHYINNYREISLNGAIKKIYELGLLCKGLEFVISCDIIHPNNTTNMKGKSTRDIATLLMNDIYNNWDNKIPTYAVFSDISQDFPSVIYEILIQRMYHYYKFPLQYINAIYDLFINCWCAVVVNGIRSDWFLQLIGLSQGRPLSPFLNMLYLDPLYYVIPPELPLKLYIYVDDLALWSIIQNMFINDIQNDIQKALNNIMYWLNLNGMELSFKKTKYIIFYKNFMKNHYDIPNLSIEINNKLINEPAPYVKYVGYYLTHNLSPKTQINNIIQKIQFDYKDITKIWQHTNHISTKKLYDYLNSVLLSKIEYPILMIGNSTNKNNLNPLSKLYYKISRLLYSPLNTIPIDILNILTVYTDFNTFMDTKYIRMWVSYLYVHDRNLIYNIIQNQWFPIWKQIQIQPFFDNRTYIKNNPLFKIFTIAKNYKILHLVDFNEDSFINHNGKIIKYIKTFNNKPLHVQYIENEYNEYDTLNINSSRIFAISDGSINHENHIGGIGLLLEYHITPSQTPYKLNVNFHNENDIPLNKYNTSQLSYQIIPIKQDLLTTGISYDINVVELIGIYTELLQIQKLPAPFLSNFSSIHVICDNDQAIYWITGQLKTNEPVIIKILKTIHKLLNALYSTWNFITYFQRTKRDTNHGIKIADELAKRAVELYDINSKFVLRQPISQKTVKKLIKKCIKNNFQKNALTNLKSVHLISRNIYLWRYHIKKYYQPLKELEFDRFENSILIQLRSGHIKLNNYLHIQKHQKYYYQMNKLNKGHIQYMICNNKCCENNNSGRCNYCGKIEDVNHFVLICPKYKIQRNLIFDTIQSLHTLYKQKFELTLKNILFPPLHRWEHRKMVLSSLILYVLNTNRLKFYDKYFHK